MILRRLIPVFLLLAAPMAMLYPLWNNPVSAGEDDVIYYYPLRKLAGEALARGEWPYTYAQEATGGPLLADPQAGVLHPATWLFAVVSPKLAYSLSIFLAFSTAGGGMWMYLRRLGLVRAAAGFGTLAFMFCGFMVGHRVHLSMLQTAAMFPWLLFGLELLRRRPPTEDAKRQAEASDSSTTGDRGKCALAFVVLVPSIFLAIAGGSFPTVIQMSLIGLAYFLLRVRPVLRALGVTVAAAGVAALMAAPQLIATAALLQQATRQKLGFAVFGENSFFPTSAVLAFFPFLMGNRSPNLFDQPWWGSWHLCESLGYVGLATLALAGATVWRLYRKNEGRRPKTEDRNDKTAGPRPSVLGLRSSDHVSVTRTWVWIALAAGVFMIGYYLPTYRYVHMVPILNVVRCPSRMVLAVDMALATLAALAVHYALVRKDDSFRRTVRRATTIVLPLIMLTGLAGMAAIAFFGNVPDFWEFFFTGTTPEAKQANAQAAFHVGNPAIWIPICLLVLTVLIVRLWTRRPTLWPVLLALLVADLFFITRFVDVPGAGARPQDPETSPAAAWLRENAPAGDYRIFSVGTGYYQRASELLLPKACHAMGFSSIASYGPFEHPRHAQLFGLSITGYSRDWPGLLRRNYLLSTANVRYIIGTEPVVREVLESVRIPESPPPADGPDLLGGADRGVGVSPADPSSSNSAERQAATSAQGKPSATGFELSNVTAADGVLRFQTPFMWRRCLASQNIEIKGDTVYRIGLDARGPEGGAANFLRAEVLGAAGGDNWDMTGLTIRQDEIGAPWRHFEWTFRSTADAAGERKFLLQSVSERPIEVRNVSLRESRIDAPLDPLRKLSPGQKVYRFRAEFPPLNAGDTPVFLYENLLARADIEPVSYMIRTQDELETSIERLKWDYPRSNPTAYEPPPSVAFTLFLPPYSALLLRTTLPATLVFAALATFFLVRSNRKCAVAPGRDNDDALP